jgi:MerR-like DNA binding protein
MQNENLVEVRQFFSSYNLEISFLDEMQEFGFIEITTLEGESYFSSEQLAHVERIIRLHEELGINWEGIDAIEHLLHKVEEMKKEISQLQNQLRFFEGV